MDRRQPDPKPPGQPAWDIVFTRLTHAVQPQVDTCVLELARRFAALGLTCDSQAGHTPRGVSTYLSVAGQRGLLCIVDITLIDGMAVFQAPRAALDIRVLDACGDVVAESAAQDLHDGAGTEGSPAGSALSDGLARAATAAYVSALGHFDLLHAARSGAALAPQSRSTRCP